MPLTPAQRKAHMREYARAYRRRRFGLGFDDRPRLTVDELAFFLAPRTWPEILASEPSMPIGWWRQVVIEADAYGGRGLLRWVRGKNRTRGAWTLTESGMRLVTSTPLERSVRRFTMPSPELPALRLRGLLDGIDISSCQTISDPEAVARAGFAFATVKVSQGLRYCDPKGLAFLALLRAAGLLCNAYTFAEPSKGDPRGQAHHFLDCLGGEVPLAPVLDLEAAAAIMTAADLVAFAEEFFRAIDDEVGSTSILHVLYSGSSFARERMQPALSASEYIARRCRWWDAQYRSTQVPWAPSERDPPHPYIPLPFNKSGPWTLQYSGDRGFRVPGIVGDCDRNLFNGDLKRYRQCLGIPEPGTAEKDAAIVAPAVDFAPRTYDGDDEPPPAA